MPRKTKQRPFVAAELQEVMRTITTRLPASLHDALRRAVRADRSANTIVYCALKAYLPTLGDASTAAEDRPQFFDGLGQGSSHCTASDAVRGERPGAAQEAAPVGDAFQSSHGA